MLREECYVGQEVIFGRGNGEQTPGIVRKINGVRAKVEITVRRGCSETGQVWGVPYSMMRPMLGKITIIPAVVLENKCREALEYLKTKGLSIADLQEYKSRH